MRKKRKTKFSKNPTKKAPVKRAKSPRRPMLMNDHRAPGHVHRMTYAGDGCPICDEMFLVYSFAKKPTRRQNPHEFQGPSPRRIPPANTNTVDSSRQVGAHASFQIGSDVYPCTIIKASPSGHQFTVQQDNAMRSRSTGEGARGVMFERNLRGDKMVFTRNKYGQYTHRKHYVLRFGKWDAYSDFSF